MVEHNVSMTDMQRKCRAGGSVRMLIRHSHPSHKDINLMNLREVTPESHSIMRMVGGGERISRCRADTWIEVLLMFLITEAGKSPAKIIGMSA